MEDTNSDRSEGEKQQTGMVRAGETAWFGMDIGGTLTKLVYFQPTEEQYAKA